jgi:hypothetical protein
MNPRVSRVNLRATDPRLPMDLLARAKDPRVPRVNPSHLTAIFTNLARVKDPRLALITT